MSSEKPEITKPGQVPTDLKAFNAKVIEEYRANQGRLSGPMAKSHVLLLTTTGAKSGKPRTVVLGYGQRGDDFVLVASGNGMPEHPLWYRNLVANPSVIVEVGAEKFTARARTAGADERLPLTPVVPYVETEQKKTSRTIPLVLLQRR